MKTAKQIFKNLSKMYLLLISFSCWSEATIKTTGGINVKSPDGKYFFKLGGRVMWDYDAFDDIFNNDNGSASETELRRLWLEMKGGLEKSWEYGMILSVNQSNKDISVLDAYLRYQGFSNNIQLTMGKFKEPFGMEVLGSSKWLYTIERSAITDSKAFISGRPDAGAMLSWAGKNATWAAGLFDKGSEDSDGKDNLALTTRLTYAPINNKSHKLHLGLAFSERNVEDQAFSVNGRFGPHTGSNITLAGTTVLDNRTQYGLEVAYINGPFSIQGEYMGMDGDATTGLPDVDSDGYYVQLAYSLTGESRRYKKGIIGGIKPRSSGGAVEFVAKVENLNVVFDDTMNESDVGIVTLGLSWYVNMHIKIAFNYVHTELDGTMVGMQDEGDAFSTRLQFAF